MHYASSCVPEGVPAEPHDQGAQHRQGLGQQVVLDQGWLGVEEQEVKGCHHE